MKWNLLSKDEADKIMSCWYDKPTINCEQEYQPLRKDLFNAFYDVASTCKIEDHEIQSAGYQFDLAFGLKLFNILTNCYKISPRLAADDNLWRYLSVCIVPDLVSLRWGLNPSRFWKEPRRIWLKVLWWYVYLSWQGSLEATYIVLKENTTDEIVQLVERSGPSGYRVKTCRAIMKQFGCLNEEKKGRNLMIFRKVMKLHTARAKVIEPSLVLGGEDVYVKELFNYFDE